MKLHHSVRSAVFGVALVLLAIAPFSVLAQNTPVEVKFYYPTAVGGPLTQIFDGSPTLKLLQPMQVVTMIFLPPSKPKFKVRAKVRMLQ